MNAPLDIGRLSTRIRSSEPERAQALAGQLRQVAGPGLTRALDGAGERALARLVAEIEGRGDGLPAREVLPFHLVLRYSTEGVDAETTTEPSRPRRAGAPEQKPTTDRRRKAR